MDYNKKPSLKSGKTKVGGQGLRVNLNPPPEDSFFYEQWNHNQQLFDEIKSSDFVEGLKASTLNPSIYGPFGIQQINISFDFIKNLESAKNRIDQDQDPELVEIYDFLISYLTSINKWNFSNDDPISAKANYSNYLSQMNSISNNEDVHPIYIITTFLPRFHILYELAQYLQPEVDTTLYKDWIVNNSSSDTVFAIGNFVAEWVAAEKEFDPDTAHDYYNNAFYYEYVGYLQAGSSEYLRPVLKF